MTKSPPRFGDYLGITNFLTMKTNPLKFLVDAHTQCGPTLKMRCGPFNLLSITQPEHVNYVLKTKASNFSKLTPGYKGMRGYLGNGILTHEGGEGWRIKSKSLRPLFRPARINTISSIINHWVNSYKTDIQAMAERDSPINLSRIFRRLTLSILCDVMFNYKDKREVESVSMDIDTCIHTAFAKLYDPFFYLNVKNIDLSARYRTAKKRLYQFSEKLLTNKKILNQEDNLGLYMQELLDQSNASKQECYDEIITFLQAGHETSSTALNALFFRLLEFPQLQLKVHQLTKTLNDSDRLDTNRIDIANQCIWESFRFDPSTWGFDRYTKQNDKIANQIDIKKGCFVIISPYIIQRHFSDFTDQLNYNPTENFSRIDNLKNPEYMPFSLGPRLCPGELMAQKEIRETLIGFLEDFEFYDSNKEQLRFKPSVTLKLSGDLHCKVRLRA